MGRSDKPTSQDEFARLVMNSLRQTGVSGEISYDPEQFQVMVEGKAESILFLTNAYREYRTVSEEHRPQALQKFIRGWLQAHKSPPEEYADIRPDILPAVRSRSSSSRLGCDWPLRTTRTRFCPIRWSVMTWGLASSTTCPTP